MRYILRRYSTHAWQITEVRTREKDGKEYEGASKYPGTITDAARMLIDLHLPGEEASSLAELVNLEKEAIGRVTRLLENLVPPLEQLEFETDREL